MKNIIIMLVASVMTGVVSAAEWEDTAVNSINRLPARTYSMPLADAKAAFTDAIEPETPYKKSLNGEWKFSWSGDPRLRVRDFWKAHYDDSDWFSIDVPSCVETRGFGIPGYTSLKSVSPQRYSERYSRGVLAMFGRPRVRHD